MDLGMLMTRMRNMLRCFLAVVTVIFTSAIISADAFSCPEKCSCSADKQLPNGVAVNCSNTSLVAVPENLPSNTHEISLSHNILKQLDLSSFRYLTELHKLVLSHCQLSILPSIPAVLDSLEVLDLGHNNFDKIPDYMPRSLKTLLLSYNFVISVDYKMSFPHLTDLKELFLDHNLITSIDEKSFGSEELGISSLKGLHKLALNGNKMSFIGNKAFQHLSELSALTLSQNNLVKIEKVMFEGLQKLKHLDLAHNRINHIDTETFRPLSNLKYLNLKSNLMTSFPSGLPMLEWLDVSKNLIRTVIESQSKADIYPVEVLNLAHNPFQCDCDLLWLKELYDQREYLLKHIELDAKDFVPSCSAPPELAGESWDMLGDKMFNCEMKESVEGLTIKIQNEDIDLTTRVGKVTDSTIQLIWSSSSLAFAGGNIVIQHYVFGHRSSSMKHIEVAAAQRQYVIKHLKALTNYVICVRPRIISIDKKDSASKTSFSLDDCIEVATKAAKPPPVASRLEIVFYYILGMLATFIGIFATIGGCAIMYGLWNHKSTHWSAKYVNEDSYLDGSTYDTDEPVDKKQKQHKD